MAHSKKINSKNKTKAVNMEQYRLQFSAQIERERQEYLKSRKDKKDNPAVPYSFYFNDNNQTTMD